MTNLYNVGSPLNRNERNNLNATFEDILRRFANLQRQINTLAGDEEVDILLQRIEDAINLANDTTADGRQALNDISQALSVLSNIISDAEQLDENVQQALDGLTTALENFDTKGVYNASTTYRKNAIVRYGRDSYIALKTVTGITPTDDGVNWRLFAQGGIDGQGAVNKVNNVSPDGTGNVILQPGDIGSVSREEFNQHLKNFISVSRFGVSKDSTAIQEALDFVESIGGGEVIVPSGVYSITSIVQVPSNVKLKGSGEVIFKREADIGAILTNKTDGFTGGYDANVNIELENIKFDGNNASFPTHFTSVAFGHCNNIKIKNCEFYACTTWHDIELNGVINALIYNCDFSDYRGTSEAIQLDFSGSESQFPWFSPYDDTACKDITIEKCNFKGSGISIVNNVLTPVHAIRKAIGNHSFKEDVYIDTVTITNCRFEGYNEAISLQDISNLKIANCVFLDCIHCVVHEHKTYGSNNWILEECEFIHRPEIIRAELLNGDSRFIYGKDNTPAVPLFNLRVINNKIIASTWNVIGGTFDSVTINDNMIANSRGNGIYLFGCNKGVIKGNNLTDNNRNKQEVRADIVIGNNATKVARRIRVCDNDCNKLIVGTNTSAVVITDNFIDTLVNPEPSVAIIKNNLINGTWTP